VTGRQGAVGLGLIFLVASCVSAPLENSVEAAGATIARSADIVACGKDGDTRTIRGASVRDQLVCDRHLIPSAPGLAYGSRCYPVSDFQWFAVPAEAMQKVCEVAQ